MVSKSVGCGDRLAEGRKGNFDTGSLLFRVPNPMALCQNHCALRNGSLVSLQASRLKGIHLIRPTLLRRCRSIAVDLNLAAYKMWGRTPVQDWGKGLGRRQVRQVFRK